MSELKGVEIFKAGTWNGETTTIADLDAIVAAFFEGSFLVPLKLGSHDKQAPRCGYVTSIRRVGDKLVANFARIPTPAMRMIRERGLDHCSCEVRYGVTIGTRRFRIALSAVALLGAETPAVSDLAPLRTYVQAETDEDRSLSHFRLME